eukprot:COSAG01_NODE_6148_length_3824_cov_36.907979_3_plen_89_part_00
MTRSRGARSLTVYRDQQFSADMTSAAVKRIEDVRALRAAQFPEDAGPTAHPIRPEHYIAMDNFYTATVYVTRNGLNSIISQINPVVIV